MSSNTNAKTHSLTSKQMAIIIGSVCIGLLILLILIIVIFLRRSRRQEYERPQDVSKGVDDVESMVGRAEADSLFTTKTESQIIKDAYIRSSSVPHDYAGLATHEAHVVSLDIAQSPKDDVEFENVDLRSDRPSSSKSTIKLPPLSIPRKTLNRSKGRRSTKRKMSRKSSKPPDSGSDSDESASLYSVASAPASAYFSNSSLETIKPPPVPPIPIRFALSTQLILPKSTDVIATAPRPDEEEETIPKSLPTLPTLPPLPSFKFNGDDDEEEEDETQIYNVAKLLHSRQAKLLKIPRDAISRDASIVSHIERSGSINAVITPTDEESYRPRYNRLKQRRNTEDSFALNLSTNIRDSISTLPNPHPLTPSLGS